MTYVYCIRQDIVLDERKKAYTVYGIDAIRSDGASLLSFSDIFSDLQRAEQFVKLCNDGGLSLIQLSDAVEDALAEPF